MYAGDDLWSHADRCSGAAGFGGRPVAAAETLLNRDAVGVDTSPPQADQFRDPEAGPYAHIEHRGVRFGDVLHQIRKLLGRNDRLLPPWSFVHRQLQTDHGVLNEKS